MLSPFVYTLELRLYWCMGPDSHGDSFCLDSLRSSYVRWETSSGTGHLHRSHSIVSSLGLELSHLGRAVEEAGIYSEEEVEGAAYWICKEITGNGRIVFTWLEPSLSSTSIRPISFVSTLSLNLRVPSFGERAEKLLPHLPDLIEIRSGNDAYELVFLTSEQQYCWPESTRDKGLVLFRLPYKFMWALQTVGEPWEANKEAHAILAREPNLKPRLSP